MPEKPTQTDDETKRCLMHLGKLMGRNHHIVIYLLQKSIDAGHDIEDLVLVILSFGADKRLGMKVFCRDSINELRHDGEGARIFLESIAKDRAPPDHFQILLAKRDFPMVAVVSPVIDRNSKPIKLTRTRPPEGSTSDKN